MYFLNIFQPMGPSKFDPSSMLLQFKRMLFLDHKFFKILSLDHRSMTMPSHGMVSRLMKFFNQVQMVRREVASVSVITSHVLLVYGFYYAIIVRLDYGEMYCILRSNLNHMHYRFARRKANGNGKTKQKVTTVADNASVSSYNMVDEDDGEVEQPMV
ncbi:hypothetical protein Tco_1084660 [Tanacetum coccineum]